MADERKVQTLTLDDGRRVERHVATDEQGNEITEVFVEQKRPLELQQRIVKEYKKVVAKEVRQTIENGVVVKEEEVPPGNETPIQEPYKIRPTVTDDDCIHKDELAEIISQAVVVGMESLLGKNIESPQITMTTPVSPVLSAQSIVEKNVEDKQNHNMRNIIILAAVVVGQVIFFAAMAALL